MADPETDLDAAERALGTLPRTGESLEEARLRRAWEARLAPLARLVAPVPPSEALLGRILARIDAEDGALALAGERRRTARWRASALAAAAVAAVAAVLAVLAVMVPSGHVPEFVLVATGEDGAPALVISLDADRGLATVRPVRAGGLAEPGAGSLELWHIPEGGAPVSLGLVDPAAPVEVALHAMPGDHAAISLEPPGGSPTGQPTGQVLYSGLFVPLR